MIRVNLVAIFAYFFLFLQSLFAQFGWSPINPGTNNNINSVFFINNNTGYLAGEFSTLLKSTNGGLNWVQLNSPVSTNFTGYILLTRIMDMLQEMLGRL